MSAATESMSVLPSASPGTSGRRVRWQALSASLYLLLAVIAYLPVLMQASLLADDFAIFAGIKSGKGVWNYRGVDFYRPLVNDVLTVFWRLFGHNPLPYHILNVLLLATTGWFARLVFIGLIRKAVPHQTVGEGPAFVAGAKVSVLQ
jgi:hypothetical protein